MRAQIGENAENGALRAKNNAQMNAKAGIRPLTRAALGDIANKGRVGETGQGQGGKDQKALKPARAGLTKQKATSALNLLPQRSTRSKKSSSPVSSDVLPMETEVTGPQEQNDVEMDEAVPEEVAAEVGGQVEDIDADDVENPQMATDYVNEIYAYMRQLEDDQCVKQNYLEELGKVAIKPKMRNLLVDWMVEVHSQFSLLQETLYLSVAILDRYLQVKAGSLTTKQLQLVGVSSMLLAAKYEEMYPPEIADFVYITDQAYTESQIRKMEIAIFASLDFDLGRPLPLNFLRRNSKAGFVDATVHTLAKYVMELALVEYKLCHVAPSVLAAASLAFAIRVLDPVGSSLKELWTPTLVHYSAYKIADLLPVIQALSAHILQTSMDLAASAESGDHAEKSAKTKKLKSVGTKYGHRKFGKISLLPQLRGPLVQEMAGGNV